MKLPVFLIFLLTTCFNSLLAQQNPMLSQFYNNKLWYNPAFAGAEDKKNVGFSYRNHNVNNLGTKETFSNLIRLSNTQTYILSYDQPLNKINSGIGAIIMHGQERYRKFYKVGLAYNYKINFGEFANLRLGMQASALHLKFDFSKFKLHPLEDPIPPAKGITPDFDLGALFTIKDLFIGFSTQHLFTPELYSFGGTIERKIYYTAGYKLSLGKNFKTTPSALLYYSSDSYSEPLFDVNNTFTYKDKFRLGASFRVLKENTKSIIINGGITIFNKLDIMLSYDFPNAGKYPGPAYETSLRANF